MFDADQYQLLDFGDGRKLERFGAYVLDRPCPAAAAQVKSQPALWRGASARYDRTGPERGVWSPRAGLPDRWCLRHGSLTFELTPTTFGHLGVFTEQAENWDWIARQVRRAGRPLRVLNLFAYTGGSTLAAAAAGAEVVHVDSAKNIVAWARRNAQASGLEHAPIRWIVEDAQRFAARELRRGTPYDAVILDPPSYGHGPQGESWKVATDLAPLLDACARLTQQQRAFMLLTCHSPGFGPAELEAMLNDSVGGSCQAGAMARPLCLAAGDGRRLACGAVVRWAQDSEASRRCTR